MRRLWIVAFVAAIVTVPSAAATDLAPTSAMAQATATATAGASDFAVPKASCGAGSRPEPGLQGQVPLAEQVGGKVSPGYQCNLKLVGQYTADGGAIMMAWHGDCAYMPTGYPFADPEFEQRKGVIVIDAADPAHPKETARLKSIAMVNPWESLKANATRGLLAAGQGGSFPLAGPGQVGPGFDIYDVGKDCRHPTLRASVNLPNAKGHEGDFAPDGKTYYQSTLQSSPAIVAIDIADPANPKQLGAFADPFNSGGFHAVQISDDGMRGYFMSQGAANGLAIFDLSDIQLRRPNPKMRLLGHVAWKDNSLTQIGRFVRIGGKPYIIATDEFGAALSPLDSCQKGLPPWGYSHIVDVSDELHPKVVSTIKLEVNDPANCFETMKEQNSAFSLMYSSHYCNADDPRNTAAIACAWIGSGVRVFDVRDPLKPREIAYYNPPARLDTVRGTAPWFSEAFVGTRTKDGVGTQIRWKRDASGTMNLWFISGLNGFQIVKFTNGTYPLAAASVSRTTVAGGAASGTSAAAKRRAAARADTTPAAGDLPATGGLPAPQALVAIALAAAIVLSALGRRPPKRT